DDANAIALDSAGAIYVAGFTDSTDFPTTPGAAQLSRIGGGSGFVAKITVPANTPVGANVSVSPTDPATGSAPVTLTFSNVTQAGHTTVATTTSAPPLPNGFSLGTPPVFYQRAASAVLPGLITI